MAIPTLPLFRHRDTVVTPADQNQFVAQFENTMDTLSNGVIPAINLAITDINGKVITATTARDESVTAKNIAVAAKNEALTAVATLQGGAIDNTTIAPNKAFSNQYINNNFVKLTENQTVAGVKTFTSSPIVPTPTTDTQAANKQYADLKVALADFIGANVNLTEIGYQKLPSGLIIQWGHTTTRVLFSFPISFPNKKVATIGIHNGLVPAVVINNIDYFALKSQHYFLDSYSTSIHVNWFAIGY